MCKKTVFPYIIITFLTCISPIVMSDLASDVAKMLDNDNFTVVGPSTHNAQSARYTTLGGISMRTPVVPNLQLGQIQTPRFSAGCGGIDLYAGGFSAINADQFVENLRAIEPGG